MTLLIALGQLWASPLTLLGLFLALAGGARWHSFDRGVLRFYARETGPWAWWFGKRFSASTIGAVTVYKQADYVTPGRANHERQHAVQAWMFGLLLPVLYLLGALTALCAGLDAYADNPFEAAAKRKEHG